MIDIAIGVIIGNAFNKVVDVMVEEVFLPPLSLLTDGINLENKRWILRAAVKNAEGVDNPEQIAIGYGHLLESFVDFLIISFVVFLFVRFMNRLRNKAEDPEDVTAPTPRDIKLLNDIKKLMEQQVRLQGGEVPPPTPPAAPPE